MGCDCSIRWGLCMALIEGGVEDSEFVKLVIISCAHATRGRHKHFG